MACLKNLGRNQIFLQTLSQKMTQVKLLEELKQIETSENENSIKIKFQTTGQSPSIYYVNRNLNCKEIRSLSEKNLASVSFRA